MALLLFNRLGQEFIPTLDEKRIPRCSPNRRRCSLRWRKPSARFPQVAFVYSKTGTAEIASYPMPPNVSDTFIILKPQDEWPNPQLPKEALIAEIERGGEGVTGQCL
jgi:cobalt-zinc-cadmium resistance protein CzcA